MSDTGSSGPPPQGTIDSSLQNALIVGGGVALLALAAFLGLEFCLFCGPPDMEIVAVTIDKACMKRIDREKTAKQKDQDVLVWRIESECTTARDVLICTHPQAGAPPLKCLGDPRKAVLETPFQIDAAPSDKVRSYIICPLEWPTTGSYTYKVEFLTQDPAASPPPSPLACLNKDYELALEVVP